ncbi:MAG: CHRD domain-containing protein [Pedosphaera sp.]|nr:CHRD domain-containing protein [Pedosphaera sp.]
MEFRRSATNVVIAGNYVGFGFDGKTNYTTAEGTALLLVRKDSSIRVGSNVDGKSDAAEANHFANFAGPMFKFHNNNNDEDNAPVRIAFRGNEVVHCFGVIPVNPSQNVTAERFFTGALALPATANAPILKTNSTPSIVIGTVPAGADGVPAVGAKIEVDFYLADLGSLAMTNADFPAGSVQGGKYLGTFAEGGSLDLDVAARSFRFNIAAWGLSREDLKRLTCTANYRLSSGAVVTSLPADVLGDKAQDALSSSVSIAASVADGTLTLTITGGKAPFLLQFKASLADATWNDIYTTSSRTISLPIVASVGMFRVSDSTTKSVKLYRATLSGGAEKPTAIITSATGAGFLAIDGTKAFFFVSYQGLKAKATASYVHRVDLANGAGSVAFALTPVGALGTSGVLAGSATITAADAANVEAGKAYFNIHTSVNPEGEIRGDLVKP